MILYVAINVGIVVPPYTKETLCQHTPNLCHIYINMWLNLCESPGFNGFLVPQCMLDTENCIVQVLKPRHRITAGVT